MPKPKLESFKPFIRKSEIFFLRNKIILKSGLRQMTLPIQSLYFLIYFNGQYKLTEIVKKNLASYKTVHFGLLFSSLIKLKENGFLVNEGNLNKAFSKRFSNLFNWSSLLKTTSILPPFSLKFSFHSPLIFQFISILLILLSLVAAYFFPVHRAFSELTTNEYNYTKSLISIMVSTYFIVNFKFMIQAFLQLIFLGQTNIQLTLSGLYTYFYVSPEPLFSYPKKILSNFYFLAGISSCLIFPFIIDTLPNTPWILEKVHLATLIVLISNLNIASDNSDINHLFKMFYNEDHFYKISRLLKNYTLTNLYWKNAPRPIQYVQRIQYIFLLTWLMIALACLYYYSYKNHFFIIESLELGLNLNKTAIYIFLIFITITFAALILQFFQYTRQVLSIKVQIKDFLHILKNALFLLTTKNYNRKKLSEILKQIDLLNPLDSTEIKKIIANGQIINYKKNERIIKQGAPSTDLFILLQGQLTIRHHSTEPHKTLGYIKPFSTFGETALLDNKTREADVIAAQKSIAFKIHASSIKNILYKSPNITKDKEFKDSIVIDQFFYSSPIFRSLSEETIHSLKEMGKIVEYKNQKTVFEEGQLGESIYLTLRGSVDLYVRHQLFNTIEQGSFFGEESLMANIPRATSARTNNNATLFVINRENFWYLISKHLDLAILIDFIGKFRLREIQELRQTMDSNPKMA